MYTGIDVNPRFHDCRSYEFTDEVAIFDLLDIPLVHGWLVDPQVYLMKDPPLPLPKTPTHPRTHASRSLHDVTYSR